MIECQRLLLGDAVRNDAFFRALQEVIVPGDTTIADIGSGTGYLSFLAEEMGAKRCDLYEVSADLLALSKRIAKANAVTRCTFVHAHSTSVKKPAAVDVVISETLGNFAYEENIIETMNDAKRFLDPGGVLIPQTLKQFVAPVTSPRLYEELNVWNDLGHHLDFNAAKEVCMNNMYVKDVSPEDLLGEGAEWDTVNFLEKNSSIRDREIAWTFASKNMLYGFAVWWEAQLTDAVSLSTSPWAPPTHWKQIYLPLIDPLPMKKDWTATLRIRSDSRYAVKIHVQWETSINDEQGRMIQRVKQDMRKGQIH